jgi:S-adenosylmethionine:tRNA ribosyltransferase-isomerase
LIAQEPLAVRDRSRLLVVDRKRGTFEERVFGDVVTLLAPGDLLVVNDSRVFAARLRTKRASGRRVEVLLLGPAPSGNWHALVRPSKAVRVGEDVLLPDGRKIKVLDRDADGMSRQVAFPDGGDPFDIAAKFGAPPLPPYIRREPAPEDRDRYQTVYAREQGSAAAPTAGLHFTEELLASCARRGIGIARVTLHVGTGTFLPMRGELVEEHRMHPEYCTVPAETCTAIARAKANGGRVVAVGTTSVRSIESALRHAAPGTGFCGWTDLFIRPPFEFKGVDALVTNFHLPRSTLLVLVSAFAGRELALRAYAHAVTQRFRFYSYGDAMLIL